MLVPVPVMVQDWHVMRAIVTPPSALPEMVTGLTTDALLRRALEAARSIYIRKGTPEPRWIAVRNCLRVTKEQARRLCEWAELDPDELVHR